MGAMPFLCFFFHPFSCSHSYKVFECYCEGAVALESTFCCFLLHAEGLVSVDRIAIYLHEVFYSQAVDVCVVCYALLLEIGAQVCSICAYFGAQSV